MKSPPLAARRRALRPSSSALPVLLVALGLAACQVPPSDAPAQLDLAGQEGKEQAVVYGTDGRLDWFQVPDPSLQTLTRLSSVVLVNQNSINAANPNDVSFFAPTLSNSFGGVQLCPDESFGDQPALGDCSGALIDDDLVLTAGHCMIDAGDCASTKFVFDVHYQSPGALQQVQLTEDVYNCAEIVVRAQAGALDFAVVRLDRAPTTQGKVPVPVIGDVTTVGQPIVLAGYPTGIPLKIDAGGTVINPGVGPAPIAFNGTPDAFGGNSGSPVFTTAGEQVGILVAGATDYTFDNAQNCLRVNVLGEDALPGETITYAQRAVDALCDDGYPSLRLCPDNVDPSCQACDLNPCPAGYQCGQHPQNPMVTFCRAPCGDPDPGFDGGPGGGFDGGAAGICPDGQTCQGDSFCSPDLTPTCSGGDVWQIDSCDNLVTQLEGCASGCVGGACVAAAPGDTCATAIPIAPVSQTIVDNSATLSDTYDNSGCNTGDGPEAVYAFTLDEAYDVEFNASGFDTLIHMREGNCESPAAEVFCDDDGGPGTASRWQGTLGPGTYFFFMDRWGTNDPGGTYTLEMSFVPTGQCEDQCPLGEQRCAPFGPSRVQLCLPGPDGCTEWNNVQPCGGAGCTNGQCNGPCTDECPEEGASGCADGNLYGECGFFDDDPCLDAQLTVCDDDEMCMEGEGCVADCLTCAPGEQRCASPDVVERCVVGPDGCSFWGAEEFCEFGFCSGGFCVDECFECEPGAQRCGGPFTVESCEFDAVGCTFWNLQEFCEDGAICDLGTCVDSCFVCEIGQLRCGGPFDVEQCVPEPDGCSTWEPFEFCEEGFCENGACVGDCVDECFPEDSFCLDDFTALPCGNFDADFCLEFGPPTFCPDGAQCVDGSCDGVCGDECVLGDERCRADGLLERCVNDAEGCTVWGPPFACEGGGVCDVVTGECPECASDCTLGQAECLNDSSYRVCLDEDGDGCAEFSAPRFCFGETVCEEGLCVLDAPSPDAGPEPAVDAGPVVFPSQRPSRIKVAPPQTCDQSSAVGLSPFAGLALLGLARRRRRRS